MREKRQEMSNRLATFGVFGILHQELCNKARVTGYQGEEGTKRHVLSTALSRTLEMEQKQYVLETGTTPSEEQLLNYVQSKGHIEQTTIIRAREVSNFLSNPPVDRNAFYRQRDANEIAKLDRAVSLLGQ